MRRIASAAAEKKWARFSKWGIAVSHQLHPGFMDQSRRLQRIARRFTGHFLRRNPLQLGINKRKQLLGTLLVAVPDLAQDFCDFRHTLSLQTAM